MWKTFIAIAIGGTAGSLLRWWLGVKLNTLFPVLPPGTLAANLIGAYVVGIFVAFFAAMPSISPEWRPLLITGFCGGLTTFSTFSAEVVALIQQERITWALSAIAIHVSGSLIMTMLGIASFTWLRSR